MTRNPSHNPASALDVAEFILTAHGAMSALKLQKLVYYAQVWSLVDRGTPLFADRIEAWKHGPVVTVLYQLHSGARHVKSVHGRVRKLAGAQRSLISEVLAYYGDMTPSRLRHLTHDEDPWKEARSGLDDDAPCSVEITHDAIVKYYSKRPWGGGEPIRDLSGFSSARARDARKEIREGKFVNPSGLTRGVPRKDR